MVKLTQTHHMTRTGQVRRNAGKYTYYVYMRNKSFNGHSYSRWFYDEKFSTLTAAKSHIIKSIRKLLDFKIMRKLANPSYGQSIAAKQIGPIYR